MEPEQLRLIKEKMCRDELHEDEVERAGQIQYIRDWIIDHPYLECRTDDGFILRFLRAAKFILPTAQKRIERFCTVRTSESDGEPQWFQPMKVDEDVIKYLRQGFFYILPGLDDEGRIVAMTKFGVVKPKKIDLNLMFRSFYMAFDIMLMREEAQVTGLVFIEDAAGMSMEHMKHFPRDVIKRSTECWQDVYPVRIKAMHYINMNAIMNGLMEIFKLFLNEKNKSRMKIHWKPEDILNKIPKRMLPKEYGGDAGTVKELVEQMIDNMKNNADEIEELCKCKVNDAKRPRKEVKGDSWGMVGSYRKIGTD